MRSPLPMVCLPMVCFPMVCRQFLLMCLLAMPSLAASGIAIGEVVVNAQGGGSIDITWNAVDQDVTAVQFDIQYQDQALGLSVLPGSAIGSAEKTLYTSNPTASLKRILIAGANQTPIADGILVTLEVAVKPVAPPGFYALGIVNVMASAASGFAVAVPASPGSVTVPGVPGDGVPTVLAVKNAASWAAEPVAPGEIVVIGGNSLGAPALRTMEVTSKGLAATTLAGSMVLFDGIPAPLVYTTQNLVSAVVPYGIEGRSQTALQVEYLGARSTPVVLTVAGTSPGIFTLNGSGAGQGAIVNQDGSINGPGHPAPRGSVVSIFGTGEGQTAQPGVDGSFVATSDLRHPLLPVTVSIGGQSAEVLYAGSAGNQISGLFQVKVLVPASLMPGDSLPVMIDGSSQAGVTMAVQ
jgi:uncharacterized protein (TIGR03437 family)